MPVCEIYLLSLHGDPTTSVPTFLNTLKFKGIVPVLQARPLRWIYTPSTLSSVPLLALNLQWHLLIVLSGDQKINTWAQWQIAAQYKLTVPVNSQVIQDLQKKNEQLLRRSRRDAKKGGITKAQTTSDFAAEIGRWAEGLSSDARTHPVLMFNLLAFEKGGKEKYQNYMVEIVTRVGAKHGCKTDPIQVSAKFGGPIAAGQAKTDGWDDVTLADYPSIEHALAMIGSEAYQEINEKYRIGTLKDTCTLCLQEIDINGKLIGETSRDAANL